MLRCTTPLLFLVESTICLFVFHIPMPTLTIELLSPKARTILDGLEDAGLIAVGEVPKQRKTHSIMELKGLGAELWKADALPNLEGGATLEDFPKPDTTKTPKPGCMRGRIWMADATPNLEGDALMMLVEDTEQIKKTKKPLQLGCMEGEIWMADDFDAPLEDFKEYM